MRLTDFLLAGRWKPVPYTTLKDPLLAGEVYERGFAVKDFLTASELETLRDFFAREHQLNMEEGAVFNSVFSTDHAYRKKVYDSVNKILERPFGEYLKEYRITINTFLCKLPGEKSEVRLHQDMSSCDEYSFSPLSIWIPLQDISSENGGMCFIPRSHFLARPYRDPAIVSPWRDLSGKLEAYLEPVDLKAGQAIIFDPRTFHYSGPNLSGQPRVALICGVFPVQARIMTFHPVEGKAGKKMRLYFQSDDYAHRSDAYFGQRQEIHEHSVFFKTIRPYTGHYSTLRMKWLMWLHGIGKSGSAVSIRNTGQKIVREPVSAFIQP